MGPWFQLTALKSEKRYGIVQWGQGLELLAAHTNFLLGILSASAPATYYFSFLENS